MEFTGKERDSETGLDYFGARYFGSPLGRFTSPDPLMASAHASDPQSWNRYAYALNNPLRFVDPDGMDVPAACAQDTNCKIVVKVNVIYDKTVNNGKGFTNEQKKAFEANQLAAGGGECQASASHHALDTALSGTQNPAFFTEHVGSIHFQHQP